MRKLATRLKDHITGKALTARALLRSERGENFVDSAIRILIAVVIGALLLAGLYTLFGETVLPTLTERIEEMFNYGN
ncbi:MAG: hypothetical protein A4E55_02495 [Pelotomaculum sp. PtaU1.Bin035]|nr:MAG: hypothetical protein A4E55_02495 [Pelotomaculum sp. PtaU1.Bin035]